MGTHLLAILVALPTALAPTLAIVLSHRLSGKKLEVIRVDVNSNLQTALSRVNELHQLLEQHDVTVPPPPPAAPE